MFDPQFALLSRRLAALSAELAADPANPSAWGNAEQALGAARAGEPELARIIDAKDAAALRELVDAWTSGKTMLPEQDRALLKRALKAFRKSLKVTRLDEESGIGGRAMSSGRQSSVVGITPPRQFDAAVWDELVRQGRLRGGRNGIYELIPGPE